MDHSEAKSADNNFKWYIVKTKANCEFKAREAIKLVMKDHELDGKVKEVLIPEKKVVEIVKGKKVHRPKKLYPGYVFIQMDLTNQLWHLIKNVSNVINFVGRQGEPVEVPFQQVESITHQLKEDVAHPQAKISFSVGEYVKVIDGPFQTFSGVVEEVNQEKGRVKVSVSIFGRPTPVELDFSQVHREE